jgi:hypothetical protein
MWHLLKADPNRLLDGGLWFNPAEGFISVYEFQPGLWLIEKGSGDIAAADIVHLAQRLRITVPSEAELRRIIDKANADFDSLTQEERSALFHGILVVFQARGFLGTDVDETHAIIDGGHPDASQREEEAQENALNWMMGKPETLIREVLRDYGVTFSPFDWTPE